MKKVFALVLVIALFLLAGCQSQPPASTPGGNTSTPADPETPSDPGSQGSEEAGEKDIIRYVIPGSPSEIQDELTAKINSMLDRDNMNMEFQPIVIAWDVWEQKSSLMFTTGEEFDFLHIMDGFATNFNQYWAREATLRLNELLDNHAPVLKSSVPDWMWDAVRIDGSITAIPAFWVDTAGVSYGITLRKDLLDKYNLPVPKTSDELMSLSIELKGLIEENEGYDTVSYIVPLPQEIAPFLHRTYDSFPFTVVEQMLIVRQDGTVGSWVDSPEFKLDTDFYNAMYRNGLIPSDILGMAIDELNNQFDIGNYVFAELNTAHLQGPQRLASGIDTLESIYVHLSPEKPDFRYQGIRNSNVLSATSPNPEAAIRFHEWIYSTEDAFWALTLGEEGVHYNRAGSNEYELIPDAPLPIGVANWMISNINLPFMPVEKDMSPYWTNNALTENTDALNSVIIGFVFDPTPVESQYSYCLAEIRSVAAPMRVGVVSYEDGYENASAALKAAGIDDVVAEYQKQLSAFLASR